MKNEYSDYNLHELTRQGKNICPNCGNPKEMYYKPWCRHCEKPELETVSRLNFIQSLRWMEAHGRPGIRDRLWDYFSDEISNDSNFTLCFPDEDEKEYMIEDGYQEVWDDLQALQSEFGLKKSVLMHVSW